MSVFQRYTKKVLVTPAREAPLIRMRYIMLQIDDLKHLVGNPKALVTQVRRAMNTAILTLP